MENLTVVTKDPAGRYNHLRDVTNLKIETSLNGFSQATWTLNREMGAAWDDLGPNFQVYVFSGRGDIAWYGRQESIEPAWNRPVSTIGCTAVGYWANTEDRNFAGIVGTNTTPETMINNLVSGGYLTQLSTTTNLTGTGLTGRSYETDNGGLSFKSVADIINAICQMGTSTSGYRVIPYISFDDKRVLSTRAVYTSAALGVRYRLSRKHTKSLSLRRALSSAATRIILQYKDLNDSLQTVIVEDTTVQANLGMIFSGSTVTPFVRERVIDISSSGPRDVTDATNVAYLILSWAKRIQNDSQDVVVDTEYSVYDTVENQEVPLWKVRAGYWLQFTDLIARPSDSGSGTSAGDAALQSSFFLTKTSYDVNSGELTITPEGGATLDEIIAKIVPKTEALTEWHYKIENRGTAFPTTDLSQGRRFYRTDLGTEFYRENNFSGPPPDWYYSGKGATDNFNESDNSSTMGKTQSGQIWQPQQGTWGISSNKAASYTDTDKDLVLVETGVSEQTVQVTMSGTVSNSTNQDVPIMVFRANDSNNYLMSYLSSGNIYLSKMDGGLFSVLVNAAVATPDNTDFIICSTNNGNAISVYLGGTLYLTYTLSGTNTKYASYTKVGFRLAKSGTPAYPARFDSLKVRQKF